jgi:DNA modification methylase
MRNERVTHCRINDLAANPWGLEVGPPLSIEDAELLEASIARDGIQIPLIVWEKGKIVLSGTNRLRIAKARGMKTVPIIARKFAGEEAARIFAISDNLARRHMNTFQKTYLGHQYRELIKVGQGKRTDLEPSLNSKKVDSWQAAAKKAGVSTHSLHAMKTIVDSGDKKLLQDGLEGKITLHAAVRLVRAHEPDAKPKTGLAHLGTTKLLDGDCRAEMKKIDDKSVDLVLTDPPYPCIGKKYGMLTEAAWLNMMKGVVAQCRRVLKSDGSAIFILQPNFETLGKMRLWAWKFVLWAAEEWNLVQDAYWWCTNTLPSRASNRKFGLLRQSVKWCVWLGQPDCYRKQESVLWRASDATDSIRWEDRCLQRRPGGQFVRDGRTAQATMERNGATPFNLLPLSATHPNESVGHPASTPYALADWWCKYLLPVGGTLLDPFVGSGTTLLAALDNGASQAIGIDKEPKYLAMAKQKLHTTSAA